jgi:UDP-N-acetyl-D-mannosaminuronic acid dehydrogenase
LSGARVLILGVTYRGAVKETAFSGAFGLRDELLRQGAQPLASDPMYSDDELRGLGFEPWDGAAIDGVIVQADHPEYSGLSPADVPGVRGLVDGRAIVHEAPWASAGIPVARIGQLRSHPEADGERPTQAPGAAAARV